MGDLLNTYLTAGIAEAYSNSGTGFLAPCWELLIEGTEQKM